MEELLDRILAVVEGSLTDLMRGIGRTKGKCQMATRKGKFGFPKPAYLSIKPRQKVYQKLSTQANGLIAHGTPVGLSSLSLSTVCLSLNSRSSTCFSSAHHLSTSEFCAAG